MQTAIGYTFIFACYESLAGRYHEDYRGSLSLQEGYHESFLAPLAYEAIILANFSYECQLPKLCGSCLYGLSG